MNRRTLPEVRDLFTARQFKLLDEAYHDNKTPLLVLCPLGHECKINLSNFLRGHGCATCAGINRWTTETVQKEYLKYGYSLLSATYENTKGALSVLCPKNHTYKATFGHFLRGSRCTICAGNIVLDIGQVRELLKTRGFKLISGEYINASSPLQIECSNGHIFASYWAKASRRGCPQCQGGVVLGLDQFKVDIERTGYKLLSNPKEYKNQSTQLLWLCPREHQVKISQRAYRRGKLCGICSGRRKPPLF